MRTNFDSELRSENTEFEKLHLAEKLSKKQAFSTYSTRANVNHDFAKMNIFGNFSICSYIYIPIILELD